MLTTEEKKNIGLHKLILVIINSLSKITKINSLIIMLFIFVSGMLDIISIGIVVPLITLFVDPNILLNSKTIISIAELLLIDVVKIDALTLIIYFISVIILSSLFKILTLYFSLRVAKKIGAEISSKIFKNILMRPYVESLYNKSSEIISSLTQRSDSITGLVYYFFILVSACLSLLLMLTVSLFLNSKYTLIILFVFLTIVLYTYIEKNEDLTAMQILFQSVSFITTSGFTSTTYYSWPSFVTSLLIVISFIGACAGSTGGGLKVIRVIILFKLLKKELLKIIHPTAEIPIRVNQSNINEETSATLYNFFIFYILSYLALSFLLLMSGLDMITSFSAVASCINNLGPGLGDVALNYGDINIFAKYVLSFAMILGRLEIFTLLIVMTPYFWKY